MRRRKEKGNGKKSSEKAEERLTEIANILTTTTSTLKLKMKKMTAKIRPLTPRMNPTLKKALTVLQNLMMMSAGCVMAWALFCAAIAAPALITSDVLTLVRTPASKHGFVHIVYVMLYYSREYCIPDFASINVDYLKEMLLLVRLFNLFNSFF